MADADDLREAPHSQLAYLKDTLSSLGVVRWMWRDVVPKECHGWAIRFLVASAILTLCQLGIAWLMSYVVDGLINHDFNLILMGLVGFIVCEAGQKWAVWNAGQAREWISGLNIGALDHYLTLRFFEKSMGQHVQEGSNLHLSNIEKGRQVTINLTNMMLFEGVPVILMLVISLILLCCWSWVAGLIMAMIGGAHVYWSLYLNYQATKVCTPIEKDYRLLNRHRSERLEKIERVKTCGKEASELVEMGCRWDRIITEDRTFWLWLVRHSTVRGLLATIGMLAVLSYGGMMVWNGTWQVGVIIPLYYWVSMFCSNLWRLGNIEHQFNWSMPSIRSMREAALLEPDVVSPLGAPSIHPNQPLPVEFRNVFYSYPKGSSEDGDSNEKCLVPVIQNVSFTISAGEKIALIGESGAGKTTLMRLLLRFMDTDKGRIYVDGHELQEINLESWHQAVGYIPQHAHIFDGTLRYNLLYGLSPKQQAEITDTDLWALMRSLKIDFGERLTEGLDTKVGYNGMKLSGGQAQRLMIGAAVSKKPRFMVIDEATSSLDSSTEKAVQEGLEAVLASNVSALVVAHRLSTVRYLCDRFIVLRDASLLEDGESQIEAEAASFEELYSISPTFRRLADDQGVPIARELRLSTTSGT